MMTQSMAVRLMREPYEENANRSSPQHTRDARSNGPNGPEGATIQSEIVAVG
jgi:hypothetical protein